ncbi:ABC transporter permease [Desulforhopalus singaporensis]|uniref:Nucleoside ABC transporter membrane protein n=1 Tax=Desulforhopalus singaporensis TaxID=91360 RepID=A0A1H0R0C6_9BACT|nr:ABC transporter permease [Desulforhopalus singaporensis]SDP22458.1 nucleoside ABC transporter membrane protein [Desulforhopalus singaporensis]
MNFEITVLLLAAAVQSGTPILYATLGEILTEKSGVLNLGVEGVMILGALVGFLASKVTGSPLAGLLAAGAVGCVAAAVHGLVCLVFQGNQVVSGLALTILGTGVANYIGTGYVGQLAPGFAPYPMPVLSQLPVVGTIFFNHDPLVYLSYFIPVVLFLFFSRTHHGLNIRAVGENPAAASAAGLNVAVYRWFGIIGGGFFMGLGGAYLSLAYTHLWTTNLTAGRGWIAVALVIFAFWKPGRAVFGAYLFGGIMALQLRLQASGTQLPSSILLMLPYALTIVVLVLSSWKKGTSDEPAALGVNVEPAD